MNKIKNIIKLLRPKQWIKNVFVFPAILFSKEFLILGSDGVYGLDWSDIIKIGLVFILFCLVSSCVYIINDIMDVEEDRLHPKKRYRPIASGNVSVKLGLVILFILLMGSIALSLLFNFPTQITVLVYFLINILYSIKLKRIPVLDIVILAAGFLLRSVAGAFAIDVVMTDWFLVCIFMLSLMIGSIKRRGEFSIKESSQRSVMKKYNVQILNMFVALSSISTLLTYCIFSLTHEVTHFYITIPFVIYGIMRYLYISYTDEEQSGSPDEVIISDPHIIITAVLYVIAVYLSMFILN
jgi:4-hydroxybenzoate polyprenyltransferase